MGYVYAPDKVVEVEKIVVQGTTPIEDQVSSDETSTKFDSAGMKVYESDDHVLRFSYPSQLTISATSTGSLQTPGGNSTTTHPEGSIEVPGLFIVSRLPYSKLSEENPIFTFYSCCSGARYWFDPLKSEWKAEEFVTAQYDVSGKPLPETKTPLTLASKGSTCSIEQTFGKNKFYLIKASDEGLPIDYYYYLMTDKGYAIRFTSAYDLTANAPDSNPQLIKEASQVLSSVMLSEGVTAVSPTCL